MLAQVGLPGVQELIIIVMIMAMIGVAIVIAAALVVLYLRRSSGNDERVEELESEVERLKAEGPGTGDAGARPSGSDSTEDR